MPATGGSNSGQLAEASIMASRSRRQSAFFAWPVIIYFAAGINIPPAKAVANSLMSSKIRLHALKIAHYIASISSCSSFEIGAAFTYA